MARDSLFKALLVLLIQNGAIAIDNGLGLTPPMGYSSWNDCASEVTEERIKNVTLALISTGLAEKGYVHVNVDEGWLLGRNESTGELIEDRSKFPSGMKSLGAWIHEQIVPGKGKIMKFGLYTSRGTTQCGTAKYSAPGGHGFEKQDALWFADVGADYMKVDSCGGSQDHETAFDDYAKWRDGFNSTKRPIYFSLCGWHTWYAPEGSKLGNSWRIAGDGTNWGALSNCINQNVPLQSYAAPGGWNDPDLLQGTGIGSNDKATNPRGCFDASEIPQSNGWYQTEQQSRAQMSMWAIMSAPLLISADVSQVSEHQLETWGNEEAIAIQQSLREGGPYQGARLVGDDLYYGKAVDGTYTGSGVNVWGKLLADGDFALVFVSNEDKPTNVTCDADCFANMTNDAVERYAWKEVWSETHGTLIRPFSLTQLLEPHGGVAVFRVSPIKNDGSLQRVRQLNASNPFAVYSENALQHFRGGGCYKPPSMEVRLDSEQRSRLVLTDKDLKLAREDVRVDWREHGAVGRVQQQHPFGTCWAFSMVAVTEAINVIQGKHPFQKLSEQMVVSCVPETACGDNSDVLWSWALHNTDARYQTEDAYPYNRTCNFFREQQLAPDGTNDGYNETCDLPSNPPYGPCPPCEGITRRDGTPPCHIDESKGFSTARVRGWGFISPHGEAMFDVTRMTAALMKYGPAQIGIDASCLEGYESGIVTNCTSSDVDHAVAIVGAGTEHGIDYWIVRNSWGSSFGEQGYFRVQRDAAQMGIFGGYFGCFDEHCMVDP